MATTTTTSYNMYLFKRETEREREKEEGMDRQKGGEVTVIGSERSVIGHILLMLS